MKRLIFCLLCVTAPSWATIALDINKVVSEICQFGNSVVRCVCCGIRGEPLCEECQPSSYCYWDVEQIDRQICCLQRRAQGLRVRARQKWDDAFRLQFKDYAYARSLFRQSRRLDCRADAMCARIEQLLCYRMALLEQTSQCPIEGEQSS